MTTASLGRQVVCIPLPMRSSCGPDLGRDEDGVSVPGPWDAVAILYLFDLGTSRCIRSSCCICHPTSTSGTPAQPTSNRLFSLLPWTRLGPTRGHPSSCFCLCFCLCCCCCFFCCCCSCGIKEGLLGCVDWVPVLDAPYGRPSPSHHHPPPKKGLTHPLPPPQPSPAIRLVLHLFPRAAAMRHTPTIRGV